jgi:hypothetical protein
MSQLSDASKLRQKKSAAHIAVDVAALVRQRVL